MTTVRWFIIGGLLVLLIGIGFSPLSQPPKAVAATPDLAFPVYPKNEVWKNSQRLFKQEIYTAIEDGEVWFREFDGDLIIVIDRLASSSEIIEYDSYVFSLDEDAAANRLRGEINGLSVVAYLRFLTGETEAASIAWANWNSPQREEFMTQFFLDHGNITRTLADVIQDNHFDDR